MAKSPTAKSAPKAKTAQAPAKAAPTAQPSGDTPPPATKVPNDPPEGASDGKTPVVESLAPVVPPVERPLAAEPKAPASLDPQDERHTKFEGMGKAEVRKALDEGRFTDRRAELAKAWLAKAK